MFKSLQGHIVLACLVFGVVTAMDGPCYPPIPVPKMWSNSLMNNGAEAADAVISETTAVIEQGEGAQYYAEAWLFRGVAYLVRNNKEKGDNQSALSDLIKAREMEDQLTAIDPVRERLLLYRALMVAAARNNQDAGDYKNLALKGIDDATTAKIIEEEFNDQKLNLTVLP